MAAFGAFKPGVMSYLLPGMLLMFSTTFISEVSTYQRGRVSKCVRIENDLCNSYNFTSMPNILGHEDQKEASDRLQEFAPLIDNNCSQRIKFFLCSLLFPMCDAQMKYPIPACRKMCEEVRMDCEPYLGVFGLEWPETIQCWRLPDLSQGGCLYPTQPEQRLPEQTEVTQAEPEETHIETTEDTKAGKQQKPSSRLPRKNRQHRRRKGKRGKVNRPEREDDSKQESKTEDSPATNVEEAPPQTVKSPSPTEKVETVIEKEVKEDIPASHGWHPASVNKGTFYPEESDENYIADYDQEPSQFIPTDGEQTSSKCKNPEKFTYIERMDRCLPICNVKIDVMFNSEDKVFTYYWMLACSLLCIISSSLTVGTFLVDSKRFRYPERPIIFLSLCYLLYSSAYLVRLGRGPEGSVSCVTKDDSDVKHVVMGDLESTGCTAVFFLLYYFGMAAAVWWVILSVTWFLAAGLTWGHEAIEAHGFYFHLVAWSLPAIQTIVVLVMGKVDGDELTGLCYVGNLDRDSLLYYVILPLATYLAIGALALGCGFLSLLRIRRVIIRKSREKDAGKLEKLMLKIGLFSVLYIVPTACVVAVHVYQYNNFVTWMERAAARPCYPPGISHISDDAYGRTYGNVPEYPTYYQERGQGYAEYDYVDPYLSSRQYYHQFGQPYQGYDQSQYVLPEASYNGYGQSKYTDSLLRRHSYKPGLYQHDYRYPGENSQDLDQHGTYVGSRSIYNGQELIPVPQDLSPHYPSTRRHYLRKEMNPMRVNTQMAEALKAYGEKTSPTQINKAETGVAEARDCHLSESIPSFPIFMIKIFMSLLAGITSGVWVWSGKTYKSWKIFCKSSWCGKKPKQKGSDGNTAHGTSSAPPSVTSHLLPKGSGRPSPDGEIPVDGNRNSYPVLSDRYQGYHAVRQDDDDNDATGCTSQAEHRGNTTGLTLGDIAREHSDNLHHESTEMLGHHRSRTYIVTHSMDNDFTDARNQYHQKHQKSHSKNNKNNAKKTRSGPQRETPSYVSKSNRAIPNIYEDGPMGRGRDSRCNRHSNRDFDGAYAKPSVPNYGKNSHNRVRKYSENDANKLSLVSESGFSPMSISTRKKAGSAHVGTINGV